MNITIVGAGRAGSSFAISLRRVGHHVQLVHHNDISLLDQTALVLLCVPDDAISAVAAQIPESHEYVVAHVAGSRNLDILGSHRRVASMHPLMALPSGERGADRLVGASYCVAGDEIILDIVASLAGRVITMSDDQRTAYHAAAVVASNHLVALMGQVEYLASTVGLDLVDFLPLALQSLRDVADVGPMRALTGPASRGDMTTIDAHLAAIPESARSAYVAMANAAFEMAERQRSQSRA